MLSTENRWREYAAKGEKQVTKFMPRFDRPYIIMDVNHEKLMVTLELPLASDRFPTFHTSEVMPYNENNCVLFPGRVLAHPGPIITEDGAQEHYIKKIIDVQRHG